MSTLLGELRKSLSWTQFFYIFAKQISKDKIPETFLTVEELECLNQALTSFEEWSLFNKPPEQTTPITFNQITAFRVRTMLLEQLIPYCLNSSKKCCQSSITEIDQLQDLTNDCTSSSPIPIAQTQSDELTSKISSHIPLLDIYHTLEFDMDAMIEQRKLEKYEEQEELQEKANATPSLFIRSDQFDLKFLIKGIAENRDKTSLTDRELRHLLSEVNPNKSKWSNEERIGQEELYEACEKVLTELKNYTEHSTPFLTRVNKRDAPDYFEVIKEPMDLGTITKKLKNSQYNSKQEFARDLYLIYDNCLEYNTDPASEYRKHANAMRRKTDRLLPRVPDIEVKERHDPDFYESEDESEVVNKSTHTDGKRERSVTYESLDDDMSTTSSIKQYGGKIPLKGPKSQTLPLEDPLPPTETENEDLHNELKADKGELQNQLWRDITKKTRAKLTTDVEKQYQFDFGSRQAIKHNSLNIARLYLMEQFHHQPKNINKLIRCSSTAFARWLGRTDLNRLSFYNDEFDIDSEDEDEFASTFFSLKKSDRRKPTDEDDALRNDLFLPEYMMTPNLPTIRGIPDVVYDKEESYDETEDEVEQEETSRDLPSFDIYPSTRPLLCGLNMYIDKNVKTLTNIRSMHYKCHAIRHNLPISIPATIPDSPSSPEYLQSPIPSTKPPVEITKMAADQMMQRAIVQLLDHAGFQSAQVQPVNILNEIMSELFSNMGRTLRRYCDEYKHKMNSEEILLHTLQENGVSGLLELESYVTDDVQLYGEKLVELNQELEDNYQALIKESVNDIAEEEENMLSDEEWFITGNFSDNVTEDFFGFRELGIEKEYENLKIPVQLWYAHDETAKKKALQKSKMNQYRYPIPPKFQTVNNSQSFIGLLRPWYSKRLQASPVDGMIEDEYKIRHRPSHPPVQFCHATSKLLIADKALSRKRVLKDGSNTIYQQNSVEPSKPPMKRRKSVMDEETKAERKKQRLELKAQKKQAEKEEKKRQREELKSKEKAAKQTPKKQQEPSL